MKHVRIVSPSGAIDREYIEGATKRLLSWGYTVSVGQHAYGRARRFSATDEERLEDLNQAISDPEVNIILCSRGGYGLQRIIDRVLPTDKLIIGFSDITELHLLQNLRGHVSMHGLMCKHLATLPDNSEPILRWREALELATQSDPSSARQQYTLPAHPLNRLGTASGPLMGGNLSVIYGLQGTPLSIHGGLLFIEDIAERHYHIDRMLNNLRMSGVLSRISGLIVGQFSDCDDDPGMGETIYETIRRVADGYTFPIIFDFPAGHVERNLPLLLGREYTMQVAEHQAAIFTA